MRPMRLDPFVRDTGSVLTWLGGHLERWVGRVYWRLWEGWGRHR
jgi:hypothetical protein